MLEDVLVGNLWLALIVWGIVYVSDYGLTIYGARLYHAIALSRLSRIAGGLTGKIEYARWLTLRLSAREFLSFAVLFFLVYLSTRSWFFLGGALFTLATALQLWLRARQLYGSRHTDGRVLTTTATD